MYLIKSLILTAGIISEAAERDTTEEPECMAAKEISETESARPSPPGGEAESNAEKKKKARKKARLEE